MQKKNVYVAVSILGVFVISGAAFYFTRIGDDNMKSLSNQDSMLDENLLAWGRIRAVCAKALNGNVVAIQAAIAAATDEWDKLKNGETIYLKTYSEWFYFQESSESVSQIIFKKALNYFCTNLKCLLFEDKNLSAEYGGFQMILKELDLHYRGEPAITGDQKNVMNLCEVQLYSEIRKGISNPTLRTPAFDKKLIELLQAPGEFYSMALRTRLVVADLLKTSINSPSQKIPLDIFPDLLERSDYVLRYLCQTFLYYRKEVLKLVDDDAKLPQSQPLNYIYYAFDVESRIDNINTILASVTTVHTTTFSKVLGAIKESLPPECLVDAVIKDLKPYPKLWMAFARRYYEFTILYCYYKLLKEKIPISYMNKVLILHSFNLKNVAILNVIELFDDAQVRNTIEMQAFLKDPSSADAFIKLSNKLQSLGISISPLSHYLNEFSFQESASIEVDLAVGKPKKNAVFKKVYHMFTLANYCFKGVEFLQMLKHGFDFSQKVVQDAFKALLAAKFEEGLESLFGKFVNCLQAINPKLKDSIALAYLNGKNMKLNDPSPAVRNAVEVIKLITHDQSKADGKIRSFLRTLVPPQDQESKDLFDQVVGFLDSNSFALLDMNILVGQKNLSVIVSSEKLDKSIYLPAGKLDHKGFLTIFTNYTKTMGKTAKEFKSLMEHYVTAARYQKAFLECKFSLGFPSDVTQIDLDAAELILLYGFRLFVLGTQTTPGTTPDPDLQYERDLIDPILREIEKPDSTIKTFLQAYDATVYERFKRKLTVVFPSLEAHFKIPSDLKGVTLKNMKLEKALEIYEDKWDDFFGYLMYMAAQHANELMSNKVSRVEEAKYYLNDTNLLSSSQRQLKEYLTLYAFCYKVSKNQSLNASQKLLYDKMYKPLESDAEILRKANEKCMRDVFELMSLEIQVEINYWVEKLVYSPYLSVADAFIMRK